MRPGPLAVLIGAALVLETLATAQGPGRSSTLPAADAAAAVRTSLPDLDRRVAQFKIVRMPFDSARLSARERQLVQELVAACQWLERAYWRQSDPQGLALYQALAHDNSPAAVNLRRYLVINGSRFDLVDENRP